MEQLKRELIDYLNGKEITRENIAHVCINCSLVFPGKESDEWNHFVRHETQKRMVVDSPQLFPEDS